MKQTLPAWIVRAVLVAAVGVTAQGARQRVLSSNPAVEKADPPPATDPVAFDAATKDMSRFKLAKGLKMEVFAAEPQLCNPVQFCTDEHGRFWIAETFRYRLGGVVDVRNVDWWDEDLASKTVGDRIALITRKKGDEIDEMRMNTERLQMVEDTDGDGRADRFVTVDDKFNEIPSGIASGVIARDGKVWFANIPSLWLIDEKDGKELSRKQLHYGYGVHYSLEGHDLHGLHFGPDGRLYFSVGDRGLNVTTADGRHVVDIESGAVMRCQPDGSELELFATGLRNPQDLVFDEHGNLFTGDNNCDYGDPGRWVYVVQGGDSGWRLGYQRIAGGPWMSERQWALTGEPGGAAHILPPVAHISSGPSGVTYQPTGATGESFRNNFFLCDFRGGRVNSQIWAFRLKPNGATFDLTDRRILVSQMLSTDIETGNDGALYISDWVDGWPKPKKGRIERVFDPEHYHDASVVRTKRLIEEGMKNRPSTELAALLGYPDPRVRQAAQFEMVSRGGDAIPLLYGTANTGGTTLARLHGIWGVWQLGQKNPKAVLPLIGLLSDPDDEVRAQAAKVLGDVWCTDAHDQLLTLLKDKSPRVRFFAATALGRVGRASDTPALLAMLADNDDRDPYLRHAATVGLNGAGDVEALVATAKNPSSAVRVGALVALRRMNRPEVATFLKDTDQRIVLEAARAINDTPINAAMPALAALSTGNGYSEFTWRRILNANYRLGTPESAKALAQVAARNEPPVNMRVEALDCLEAWAKPDGKDRIMGLWRPLPDRDPAMAKAAMQDVTASLLKNSPDPVRIAAIRVAKSYGLADEGSMYALVKDDKASPDVRAAALDALVSLNGPHANEAINFGLAHGKGPFRQAAIRLSAKLPDAVEVLNHTLQTGSVSDQQMVLDTLATVDNPAVDKIESQWMDKLLANQVAPQLQLDLLETAQKSKSDDVKAKVKKYESTKPKGDLVAEYHESLAGGDPEAGRQIFMTRQDVSCIRCHQAGGPGGTVGPNLAGIGARHDRDYIMESILLPNKQIAPGFDAVTLKLKDGKSVSGILKSETPTDYTVDVVDKGIVKVPKATVASRSPGQSPMPEGLGKALSKRDMRNLVEFLADLKQQPETNQMAAAPRNDAADPNGHPAQ